MRRTIAAAMMMFCVAGAEWSSAQTAFRGPDDTNRTEEQPSSQAKKRYKSDSAKTGQKAEEMAKYGPSTGGCSQQKAMQPQDKAEGDLDASQNVVEYGGGG